MKTAVILSSCRSRSTRRWQPAHRSPVIALNWFLFCNVCSAILWRSFLPHPLQWWPGCRWRGKDSRRRLPMFRANPNSVKLKKSSFLWKVSTSRRRFLCGSTPWARKLRAGEKTSDLFFYKWCKINHLRVVAGEYEGGIPRATNFADK